MVDFYLVPRGTVYVIISLSSVRCHVVRCCGFHKILRHLSLSSVIICHHNELTKRTKEDHYKSSVDAGRMHTTGKQEWPLESLNTYLVNLNLNFHSPNAKGLSSSK